MFRRRDFLRLGGATGASLFLPASSLWGCGGEEPLPALPRDPDRWWLDGNYAPIGDEIEALDLEVTGAIPSALDGVFLRNGPNPPSGESAWWFFGDGMLHGLRIQDGRALWYRNRYIETQAYTSGQTSRGEASLLANFANTSLLGHGEHTYALYEAGLPYRIDPFTLETHGEHDFEGTLRGPMTAHPKIDPQTGEMVFIGYGPFPPYLTVHFVQADGTLRSLPIELPGSRMIHDFAMTERHIVIMDLPVTFDLEAAAAGGFPFLWQPELGARIGVLPRDAEEGDAPSWMDIDPCFIFHTFNAYDEGSEIVLEAARHDTIWAAGADDESSRPSPWRFTIDSERSNVSQSQLDDRLIEFPRIDTRRMTRPSRIGYGLRFRMGEHRAEPKRPVALAKYDLRSGAYEEYELGGGRQPDEAVFAADPSSTEEDAGWLLSVVFDPDRRGSEVIIVDASDVAAGPVATIRLPRRVPFGFHGEWFPSPG